MGETWSVNSDLERSPVLKALRLISHLASCEDPVALADLSRALSLPKPTTFRLARSLESAGFVEKDPLTRRYRVGSAFENIAWNALRRGAGHARRRLLMNELAERLGARVNLVVLKAGNLSFVEWVESTAPLRIHIESDAPMPIHCSASGKLLVAYGSPELQEHVMRAAPFKAYTPKTLTTARQFARELAAIRSRGYAEDDQELMPGINCLAVPIRSRAGEVVAGLAVMAPSATLPLKDLRERLGEVERCAALISAELGWRGDGAEVSAKNLARAVPADPVEGSSRSGTAASARGKLAARGRG